MIDALVEETRDWLMSDEAQDSIARDPYWPKWGTPWWMMLLLCEMDRPLAVPSRVAENMGRAVDTHYLKDFPFRQEDVPEGIDGWRQVLCHCALGSMYSMLARCGMDPDRRLPWARAWFRKYQMADGALNCDEGAYLRPTPRGSIMSTLPCLEAVLYHGGPLDEDDVAFLDRGAEYLLTRRLYWSLSKDAPMSPAFLEPAFPRFYDYDVLRGLAFVTAWAERLGRTLRRDDVQEAIDAIIARCDQSDQVRQTRDVTRPERTLWPVGDGRWEPKHPSTTFPLLEAVNRPGEPNPWLTKQWRKTRDGLVRLGLDDRLAT